MFLRVTKEIDLEMLTNDDRRDIEAYTVSHLTQQLAHSISDKMPIKEEKTKDSVRYHVDVFVAFNKEQLKAALQYLDEDDLMDEIVKRFDK